MGGTKIVSARPADPSPQAVGSGTLTGIATRNNQKVLVTCMHVMAGTDDDDVFDRLFASGMSVISGRTAGNQLQPIWG